MNTLVMMRGAIAAQTLGVDSHYIDAMFRCMWAEPKKMDDLEVWRGTLNASGLETEKILELVQDPVIKEKLVISAGRSVHPLSSSAMKSTSARIGLAKWRLR